FSLSADFDFDLVFALDLVVDFAFGFALVFALDLVVDFAFGFALVFALDLVVDFAFGFALVFALDLVVDFAFGLALASDLTFEWVLLALIGSSISDSSSLDINSIPPSQANSAMLMALVTNEKAAANNFIKTKVFSLLYGVMQMDEK
ncbi:MAG TPA: hypothetical protein QF621_00935, partial [Candidatus Thalassarchaeaceae archaeon]|nr:hypothetical protein [Candidatus Thalassarchaeaceae archaeon]